MTKNMSKDQPASPMAQLMQSPRFNICILTVMGFRTTIDVDLFKQELESNLLKHTRFKSVLIMDNKKSGKFHWKRTSVHIENHVFAPDLNPDMDSPDEFVADMMFEISKLPVDMTRPLWEFHILNVKTSEANSTVLLKMHHSLGDGVSLISLLLACAKKNPDTKSIGLFPTRKQKIVDDGHMMTWLFVKSWKALLVIFNTLVGVFLILATLLFLKDTKTPIKGQRWVGLSHKRFAHRIIDFDDIKLVKTAINGTVNDVAMGVAEAGLSRYLNMRYGQRRNNCTEFDVSRKTTNLLPKGLRLRSAVCFNLRPGPIIEDLGEIMDDDKKMEGKWGNKIGIALLQHEITLRHEDPLAYVRGAKAAMNRKKLSFEPKCASMWMVMLTKLFGIEAAAAIMSSIFWNTTLTFSNMVGPREEIAPFGHPLCYLAPTVSGFPHALTIHFQSYADKFIISLSADEKLIPDPRQLCDYMVNSFEDMKHSVLQGSGLDRDAVTTV